MARLSRGGVTLVELLITMAIMAIIAAAILGSVQAAMEAARRNRTQSLVTKISGLVNERIASYQTRRIPLSPFVEGAVNSTFNNPANPTLRGRAMADIRLLAMRELMKYEMPDRWSNVMEDPVFVAAVPTTTQAMRRRYAQFTANGTPEATHQAAECLYQTVMLNTGDGEAVTLFNKQDIGDVDEDGAPEFLDGWGNPIAWVRWPAGFAQRSPLMSANAQADHDPTDVYRRDDPVSASPPAASFPTVTVPGGNSIVLSRYIERLRDPMPAFRLPPLVYSAGSDGISDINTGGNATDANQLWVSLDPIWLDPYSLEIPTQPYHVETNPFQFGTPWDEPGDGDNSIDNIHSHLNEY